MRYTKHINHKDKYFKSINNRNTKTKNIFLPILSIFLIFINIIIFSSIKLIYNSDYFKINKDTISINKNGFLIDENNLKQYLYSEIDNKLIFNINYNFLSNKLNEKYKVIKSIELVKKYPNTLTINITERKPIFSVYGDDESISYMVSEDGYIIGKTDKANEFLFKVNYSDEIIEGTYIDSNLFEIYNDIVKQVDKVNLKIENITFTKENSVVYLSNNVKVLLSNKKVIKNSFYIVDSLLKREKDNKIIDTIDLRFDKVVVSYL